MVRPMKPSEVQRKRNTKTGIRVGNKRSKKKRISISPRQIFLIAFLLLIFMGSGIGYVWSNFEGTQIGYDLSRLQQKELRLKELNQKLRVELATLKSPQNLERASGRLGLRQPLPEQIVFLP
jgi:cell division protein FtsL